MTPWDFEKLFPEPKKETLDHLLWEMKHINPAFRPTAAGALTQFKNLVKDSKPNQITAQFTSKNQLADILREVKTPYLTGSQRLSALQELQKGFQIPDALINKVQSLAHKILFGDFTIGIDYITWPSRVFRVEEYPQFIFKLGVSKVSVEIGDEKMDGKTLMEHRFENMLIAKKICQDHHLGLLVIPHAQLFSFTTEKGDSAALVVEETLDITPDSKIQAHNYLTYSKDLTESVRQLAEFVARTGFNDVAWRNLPLINEAQNYSGPRRIGLVDLEHMFNASLGIHGIWWPYTLNYKDGLIGCLSEEHIDLVIDEARKYAPINFFEAIKAKYMRIKQIADYKTT